MKRGSAARMYASASEFDVVPYVAQPAISRASETWANILIEPSFESSNCRARLRRAGTTLSWPTHFSPLSSTAMIAIPTPPALALTAISAVLARRTIGPRRSGCRELLFRRRREQRLARQANLAGVRLDAHHLHLDLIAKLEEIGHLSHARVRHLREVHQSVLTGKDLHERSVRLDALDRSFVCLPDFRRCCQTANDVDRSLRRGAVDRCNGGFAIVLHVDLRSGFLDDPADGFAAGADDVANAIFRNEDGEQPGSELRKLGAWLGNRCIHLVE